ncbi:MAG: deoxyhypusine synthase [Candidatus Thermoplasmatota archaeon]
MKKEIVQDINLDRCRSTNHLVKSLYNAGGFTAKKLATGVDILERMIKDKNCVRFLSFPACIISTGVRGVIKDLIKRGLFNVVITTTGTLDHDLARLWRPYLHGSFQADDRELHRKGIHRLGNIFIPKESYGGILEEKLQPIINDLYNTSKRWSTKNLIWEIGRCIEKERNSRDSIIYWAWRNKIPVYIPGITDGAVGSQLWMYYQTHRDLTIDLLQDEQELADIVFTAKKTGGLVMGGGISKHHTIWWNQFKDGLDYTVYVTTAVEYDGSLSGAQTREAVSWGKIKEDAYEITVEGDATVLLPLMIKALFERLKI